MTGITEMVCSVLNYQWNKLNGLLVHSKCSQENNIDVLCLEMPLKTGEASRGWSSVSQHPHEQSPTQRSRYYMIYTEPNQTLLASKFAPSPVMKDLKKKTRQKNVRTIQLWILKRKGCLYAKKSHITSFIIYIAEFKNINKTNKISVKYSYKFSSLSFFTK